MVLSRIVMDLDDADARRDLGDAYEMHATLMRFTDAGASKPLWRLESDRGTGSPIVLVQTDVAPDPATLRRSGGRYYRDFACQENRLLSTIKAGDRLRFRIRGNPTVKREGKRHGLVRESDQIDWLARQLIRSGAALEGALPSDVRREVMRRRKRTPLIVVTGVTFDGVLVVGDAAKLRAAVESGIGHAKALGFGLLTLAR